MTEAELKQEPADIKQEPTGNGHEATAIEPAVKQQIIDQVEYYFGDINLPRDKFLQDEVKKDDGWIPLETMLKFNRLAKLNNDPEVLANALQESLLIHVSDDGKKIRRNPEIPLPENSLEYWQEIKNRTVYVKGFPLDTQLDEIMEFVKPHGPVKNVLMRRVKGTDKVFKGSVFVTFGDEEAAKKFVKNDDVKEFKGQELLKLMQMDYWTKKNQENKERREAAKSLKQTKNREVAADSKRGQSAPTFVKGIVLRVTGLPIESLETSEKGKETIGKLREFFNKYGEVAFIAFKEGEDKVEIRFKSTEENYAAKVWEAAEKAATDGKVKFQDAELQASVLDGEEEQSYWADFTKSSLAKKDKFSQNKFGRGGRGDRGGRGGRGGRSGRGGGRGGKAEQAQGKHTVFKDSDEEGDDTEEPPTKKTKQEPTDVAKNGAETKTEAVEMADA